MEGLYAEVVTNNYKGVYKVVEFLGSMISVNIDGSTTDFSLKEIKRFCTEDGKNFYKRL